VIAALWFILYAYVVWFAFLAVMALKASWHRLSLPVKILASPGVLSALLADIVLNVFASVLFLDLPRQWTFSQRIGSYKKRNDWRSAPSWWICENLLDPFEIGGHCKG